MANAASGGNLNVRQQSLNSRLPKQLPAKVLKDMTNNFSPQNFRGQSVFGTVFEGTLPDGGSITVNRLAADSPVQNGTTFVNEVNNLMDLKHENIVNLVGFCHEKEQSMVNHNGRFVLVDITEICLCYDYLPKGTIDHYIYDKTSIVGWDTRFKIIKGVCQGLYFLHKELAETLIHMNLVPGSIWLDDNWTPKIADFGHSRLFGQQHTHKNTTNVKGLVGYMAPEYLYRGEISTMSDIYSLGMLILETTTGEKNFSNHADKASRNFVENVRKNLNTHAQIISKYPSLEENGYQQVKSCIAIGLKCVELDRYKRPSIVDIVDRLNGKPVKIFEEE